MKKRLITAAFLTIILVPAVVVPALYPLLQILLVLLAIGASLELLFMYDKEKHVPLGMKIVTVICTLALYASIVVSSPNTQGTLLYKVLNAMHIVEGVTPLVALGATFIILMTCMIFVPDTDVHDIGRLFMAILYIGICVAAFAVLREYGVRYIFYLLTVSIFTDVFALVFGMNFGKHKLAPHVSPKKTWEGSIGGSLTAVILGFSFMFFYPYFSSFFGDKISHFFDGFFPFGDFTLFGQIAFIIVLTFAISVCSQIGDLVASKLKRHYGIKDYSNIFPGHGGILDRFDSTLFASAIFLLFLLVEHDIFVKLGQFIPNIG